MPLSPILLGLKLRLLRRSHAVEASEYRVFTTDFDEVIDAAKATTHLPPLSAEQKRSLVDAQNRFDTHFEGERIEIAADGAALLRALRDTLDNEARRGIVVSFLIDHSRSMRGIRMISALLAVEGAVDALADAGIATEVLGFTTASWRGGRSRRAWRWAGRPAHPGRLCDLRYLVYGAAERGARLPRNLRLALRPDLLRENVDGEAMLWAAARLPKERWCRRVLIHIADGVPVDDSTLLANEDGALLARHLHMSTRKLLEEGFTIGTLLLGNEPVEVSGLFERAMEPRDAGLALLRLLRRALIPDAAAAD